MNTFSSIVLFLAVTAALIRRREAFEKQFLDPKVRVATDRGKSADFRAFGEGFTQENADEALPNDPYMNYLLWPHFHFSGTFRSDISTVNNDPSRYDTENFVAADLLQGPGNWNPQGSGEWSVTGSVSHVCYANGHCVGIDEGDKESEPLMGADIRDGGNGTWAKMVDLDTEAQTFSEIWGWRIRIGNLFSADYMPVPFQYMWEKMVTNRGGDSTLGAAYQSVLSNIRWIDNGNDSPFIKQLQKAMSNQCDITNDTLSIRFNVDMYQSNYEKNNFTTGRITGTIGLLGRKSPQFFTHGRMMKSLVSHLQDTPFYVDQHHMKVFVDFGNSLPIYENGSIATNIFDGLLVALPLNENPTLTCSDDLLWLGMVYDKYPDWYENSAGIQIFPALGSLSDNEMKTLSNHPLVVAEVSGILPVLKCERILLAEEKDGIDIHPFNKWTFRKNPGEIASVQLLATKFGKPLAGESVRVEPCVCDNIFSDQPKVGQPPLPVPPDLITDENGLATLDIQVKDPKNYRRFIDGQIYPFFYSVVSQHKNCSITCDTNPLMLLNSLFVILVWDQYTLKGEQEPTWLDDIYPIFKQYANLYPVMTQNFVDLGNYYEVVERRKTIKMSLELPMSHPNHMPVTRDLSASKRQVIVEWLSKEKPPIGEPKNFYSVENLRKDLQTALELEHSTIPPYLTALASIKYSYNLEIQRVMKAIIIQEMMHMAFVANILNAVGGKPALYSKDFIPHYPSRLPGGVQPGLVVPIEKLSLGLIRNIFMKIEQPELEQKRISDFEHIFSFMHRHKNKNKNTGEKGEKEHCHKSEKGTHCVSSMQIKTATDPLTDDDQSSCFTSFSREQFLDDFKLSQLQNIHRMDFPLTDLEDFDEEANKQNREKHGHFPGDDVKFVKHHNTIGGFYNHILNALGYLTDCGRNNSIFTGDRDRQVNFSELSVHGHSLEVYDYLTAVEAIQDIIDQGEGSSPCNPVAWDTGSKKSLAHYFLFYSVAEKHQIEVVETTDRPDNSDDKTVVDYTKLCNGTYYFNGTRIPFDPDGVWPMVSNPRMSKYVEGSKAHRQAERFNMIYTKLLKSLENVFNGRPDTLKDALGLMYSVDLHLRNLVRTPVDDNGDPDVGPNAGPTFDFIP